MTQVTCRDFTAQNYYAGQLQHYIPNHCRHPATFINKGQIKAEFYKRLTLYIADKISIVPCVIARPGDFFITASLSLVCGFVGNTLWQCKYPPIGDTKRGLKDYFEGTVVLNDTPSRILFAAIIVHVLFNNISSLMWPNEMVWYNALYVGLSVGIITSKMALQQENIHALQKLVNKPENIEPLLNSADNV